MDCDIVIIGGGSAGCVLANRLSADSKRRIILLEAGGRDLSPAIHVPAGEVMAITSKKLNWHYPVEPDPSRDGRADVWPGGKVLGGSSSINGMMYVRGNRQDYDQWAQSGATGWDYDSVLPYFKRAETNENGEDEYRGGSGPLHVSNSRAKHRLTDAFVKGAMETGAAFNPNFNGADQDGVGLVQATQKGGFRHSSARAYLGPARHRPNLKIVTGAQATRIRIERGRAVSVTYIQKGLEREVAVSSDIVVSAGAIASPKLLMLSGIGDAETLREHGIATIVDLPGVGRNLQEHPTVIVASAMNVPTFNTETTPLKILRHGLNYLFFQRGPGSTSIGHVAVFTRVDEFASSPQIQITYTPILYDFDANGLRLHPNAAVGAAVNVCRPQSRGRIELRSSDPLAPPLIRHALLGSQDDMRLLTAGCRMIRAIFASNAFKPFSKGELRPGLAVQTDAEWNTFIRRDAFPAYHAAGTCRMGLGPDAVVDPHLRVRGVDGLRVADASIMPTIPSANTNAPAIMIGEKASDLILNGNRHA